jgi:Protein of unknown function (DUF3987)
LRGSPNFRFSDRAQELFYAWFNELTIKLRQEDDEIVIEHLGKYRSLMPSLALIFHLCDMADDQRDGQASGPVSEDATYKAILCCEYLEKQARRIYGLVTNIHQCAAARLAKRIKTGIFLIHSRSETYIGSTGHCSMTKRLSRPPVMSSWRWLREYRPENPLGRPRLIEYDINPRVWQ